MGNINQSLRERYNTTFDDVVDDLPIERKLEVYQDLRQQHTLLQQLEDQIAQSLKALANEESVLREREEFLEKRRMAYMKQIDPSLQYDDEEEEENDDEGQGEKENDSTTKNIVASKDQSIDTGALGSIEVLDRADARKMEELVDFLQRELPEIQRNVALRARTLWFKRKGYEDKLDETRERLAEVRGMLRTLEPGLPPLVTAPEGVPTV